MKYLQIIENLKKTEYHISLGRHRLVSAAEPAGDSAGARGRLRLLQEAEDDAAGGGQVGQAGGAGGLRAGDGAGRSG